MKADLSHRKTHVQLLLESLEHKDTEIRFTNARRLFYVLQGGGHETNCFVICDLSKTTLQALLQRQVRQRTNYIGFSRMPKSSEMQMVSIASWRPSRLRLRNMISSGNFEFIGERLYPDWGEKKVDFRIRTLRDSISTKQRNRTSWKRSSPSFPCTLECCII